MHPDEELVRAALSREPRACRELVRRLTPVIQRQANAVLIRRRSGGTRADVSDRVQDVFRMLLEDDGRILRSWRPEAGATLEGYVGLVAERRTVSTARSGRRSGHREDAVSPEQLAELEKPHTGLSRHVEYRDRLDRVVEELRLRTSEQGYEMFVRLFVEEREVEWFVTEQKMTRDAVYAWRSRLSKLARRIDREISSDDAGSARRTSRGDGS